MNLKDLIDALNNCSDEELLKLTDNIDLVRDFLSNLDDEVKLTDKSEIMLALNGLSIRARQELVRTPEKIWELAKELARKRANQTLMISLGSQVVRGARFIKRESEYDVSEYANISEPISLTDEPSEIKFKTLLRYRPAISKGSDIALAVPGHLVLYRHNTIPPVPAEKIKQIVQYEIQQQIPFHLDQLMFDHQVLEIREDGIDVVICVMKRDAVKNYIDIAKENDWNVTGVVPSFIASYNWFKASDIMGSDDEVVALVDVGASYTDILLEVSGVPQAYKSINFGGEKFTKALAEIGVGCGHQEHLSIEDVTKHDNMHKVLIGLSEEINKTLDFFQSCPGCNQVDRIVLIGGVSKLDGLDSYLSNKLGIEVEIPDDYEGISVIKDSIGIDPRVDSALFGMMLQVHDKARIDLNLMG